MKKISQRGDTIVEVLLMVAILTAVLMGAYVLANRNLRAFREAQERVEAFKLIESQIEKLQQQARSGNTAIFAAAPNNQFCLGGEPPTKLNLLAGWNANINSDPLNGSAYPNDPKCLNVNGRYNLSIVYNPANDQFTVRARWFSLGEGKDEAKIEYRLHD